MSNAISEEFKRGAKCAINQMRSLVDTTYIGDSSARSAIYNIISKLSEEYV